MFLDFQTFMNIIEPRTENISIEQFMQQFIVAYKKPVSLQQFYITCQETKKNDIRILQFDDISKMMYQNICVDYEKTNYKFFHAYLDFKTLKHDYWTHKDIFDAPNKKISIQKNDASKRIIRNLFCVELLMNTHIRTSLPNKETFLMSWKNMFHKWNIDDRYFTPSVISQMMKGNPIHYFFQQYQPKASILNPYTIYWLLEFYFPKIVPKTDTLFTPVLSWGSYALAFAHSPSWKTYIGLDVMHVACQKTQFILDTYCIKKSYKIHCHSSEFMNDIMSPSSVDLVLMCPPYFEMEIYTDSINMQSTTIYKSYQDWLNGYWIKTVQNVYATLVENGIFSYIIGNYTDYATKIQYDLVSDLASSIDTRQFSFVDKFELVNRTSPLRNNTKIRSEYLFVFKKNSSL